MLLNAFDFRAQDKDRTKQLVDDIDERIAALNAERYSLNQNRKKILASLEEDQILFSLTRPSVYSGSGRFRGRSRRTSSS